MKVILHLGMPKTGSTALQSSLSLNRSLLLKDGILYPELSYHPTNHNILSLLEMKDNDLPRQFISWNKIQGVDLDRVLKISLNEIKEQVARHSPKILIISSENLYDAFPESSGQSLKNFFSSLGVSAEEIIPVLYVRQPSKRFSSIVQQELRASTIIPSLKMPSVVSNLRRIEKAFTKATVVTFERDTLLGNDIFIDFMQRVLLYRDIRNFKLLSASENESLSAEVISILYDYSMQCHPDFNDLFTNDRRFILKRLPALEKKMNLYSRPVLLGEIKNAVDYADKDLIILRNEFGVYFKEIDYSRAGEIEELPSDMNLRVDQIFMVDHVKKSRLLMQLLNEVLEHRVRPVKYFWRLYNLPPARYVLDNLFYFFNKLKKYF